MCDVLKIGYDETLKTIYIWLVFSTFAGVECIQFNFVSECWLTTDYDQEFRVDIMVKCHYTLYWNIWSIILYQTNKVLLGEPFNKNMEFATSYKGSTGIIFLKFELFHQNALKALLRIFGHFLLFCSFPEYFGLLRREKCLGIF